MAKGQFRMGQRRQRARGYHANQKNGKAALQLVGQLAEERQEVMGLLRLVAKELGDAAEFPATMSPVEAIKQHIIPRLTVPIPGLPERQQSIVWQYVERDNELVEEPYWTAEIGIFEADVVRNGEGWSVNLLREGVMEAMSKATYGTADEAQDAAVPFALETLACWTRTVMGMNDE
jgi:hypothetical protein